MHEKMKVWVSREYAGRVIRKSMQQVAGRVRSGMWDMYAWESGYILTQNVCVYITTESSVNNGV